MNRADVAEEIAEAFLTTPVGQTLKQGVIDAGTRFWSTPGGKAVTIVAASGAATAIIAANAPLPFQLPEIPLDAVTPGLKGKLSIEGPVRRPTKIGLTLTYTFGSTMDTPRGRQSDSDARSETREFEKWRIKTPEDKALDEALANKMFSILESQLTRGTSTSEPNLSQPAVSPANGQWRPQVPIQKKSIGPADPNRDASQVVMRTLQPGNGRPIDGEMSHWMGAQLGYDFSEVRIHTDADAAAGAMALNARAYTAGRNIVFGAGEYAPQTFEGKRLLAHELVHVVQQGAATVHSAHAPEAVPRAGETSSRSSAESATPGSVTGVQRQVDSETQEPTAAPTPGNLSPLVRKFLRGDATPAEKEGLSIDLRRGTMSQANKAALEAHLHDSFASQLRRHLVDTGVVPEQGRLELNLAHGLKNVHTFFKVNLQLRLSGLKKTLAQGAEGAVETTLELNADKEKQEVTGVLAPPEGDTSVAAGVRALAFPKGPLKFTVGTVAFYAINFVSLKGDLHITVAGPNGPAEGNIIIHSSDVPDGVTLLLTLSQSRTRPTLAPSTGSPALPAPRVFAAAGPTFNPAGMGTTLGLDVPLAIDPKLPVLYAGIGARASAASGGFLAGSGALSVGYHLSPLTAAIAIEAGLRAPASPAPARQARFRLSRELS